MSASQALSPDGKQVVVTSNVAGQTNLFAYSFDEFATDPAVTRQITTTPGNKNSIQFAPDGKSVWFLEQGRIVNVTLENKTVRQVAVRAELDVDFAREKWDVFNQAWEFLNDNFYDPEFHGTDWAAVHTAYAPLIAGAKTPDEMRRVLSLMIGEMNASHMGISAPPRRPCPRRRPVELGLEFDRGGYEQRGQLRVTAVSRTPPRRSAKAIKRRRLRARDRRRRRSAPNVSLDSLLAFKVGKRVVLSVASTANGANAATSRSGRGTRRSRSRCSTARGSRSGARWSRSSATAGSATCTWPTWAAARSTQLNLDLDAEMHEQGRSCASTCATTTAAS